MSRIGKQPVAIPAGVKVKESTCSFNFGQPAKP